MQISPAAPAELRTVLHIVRETIRAVYPRYYPAGAVDFFLAHHSESAVSADLEAGIVYLCMTPEGIPAGTVTVKQNEIARLFVLPAFQGKGYGRALLEFAEQQIAAEHSEIVLDASLPAKAIYLRHGYHETAYHTLSAGNDFLCYDEMKKTL
jgi:GNAT superfamily N-acetyltransferase